MPLMNRFRDSRLRTPPIHPGGELAMPVKSFHELENSSRLGVRGGLPWITPLVAVFTTQALTSTLVLSPADLYRATAPAT